MNKIKSETIELGMRFSAPVFFDDGKNMFLAEKKPVKKYHLDTLKKWNVPYLVTYGHLLTNSAMELDELLNAADDVEELEELEDLEELDELEEDDTELAAAEPPPLNELGDDYASLEENPLYICYMEIVDAMGIVFDSIKAQSGRDVSPQIEALADNILELMAQNQHLMASFLLAGLVKMCDFAKSAVNCAIITYLVSKKLGVPEKKLKTYIIAALVHDFGMAFVNDSIVNKNGALTAEELARLKMHSSESERLCGNLLHYSSEITDIVSQHHERFDGKGYPKGLVGDRICQGAKIIAVADAFEAMVTEKQYRSSKLGYEAMKVLINDKGQQFAPEIVMAFIQSMGVYPIGSMVLLSDASIARVVQVNENAPLRPDVRVMISSNGMHYPANSGPVVQISKESAIFVARALDEKDFHGKI